jgi:hypothetical protein
MYIKDYTFSVNINDGEEEVIRAQNLKEAKKVFAELHPEDVDKIDFITCEEDGYEEIN